MTPDEARTLDVLLKTLDDARALITAKICLGDADALKLRHELAEGVWQQDDCTATEYLIDALASQVGFVLSTLARWTRGDDEYAALTPDERSELLRSLFEAHCGPPTPV